MEVVDAVAAAVGDKRTAIRISPYSPFQEMKMEPADINETYGGFVKALKERHPDLAYLHVVRSRIGGATDVVPEGDQEETLDFIVSIFRIPHMVVTSEDLIMSYLTAIGMGRSSIRRWRLPTRRRFASDKSLPERCCSLWTALYSKCEPRVSATIRNLIEHLHTARSGEASEVQFAAYSI